MWHSESHTEQGLIVSKINLQDVSPRYSAGPEPHHLKSVISTTANSLRLLLFLEVKVNHLRELRAKEMAALMLEDFSLRSHLSVGLVCSAAMQDGLQEHDLTDSRATREDRQTFCLISSTSMSSSSIHAVSSLQRESTEDVGSSEKKAVVSVLF